MSTLIKLVRLIYPFIQEFGLKEVSLKQFIRENKTLSYLMLICILMFAMFIYALEQAHIRMLVNKELLKDQMQLTTTLHQKENLIVHLEAVCENKPIISNDGSTISIEESLLNLMGKSNEE